MTQTGTELGALLAKHFGYSAFRGRQEDIIRTVLAGQDCLAVMPTGSGKSLCFQLPALCLPGVTLVISPLIALMKDQVDGLRGNGIDAAFLNSSLGTAEQSEVRSAARAGQIRLLYIAPERLAVPGFFDFLRSIGVTLIAIDEAHCISEWGHDFRPDYRNLRTLREAFPHVPCIALTATATPKVREDIRRQLGLEEAPLFLTGFNRTNLTYHVYPKARSFERLLMLLRFAGRLPAIVYCFSRKDTDILSADLRAEGFRCLSYHAGLNPSVRRRTQDAFMRDEADIVCATIAFGMGVDKPDVRTVIHMDLPKNIESYYQETGRAGRDGLPSDCILFFSYGDKFKQEYFINQMENPQEQQTTRRNLEVMLKYGEIRTCRRAYLLRYFEDQNVADTCTGCDVCLNKTELFDGAEIARKILLGVIDTGERFGSAHVCDVLRGKNTERIRALQHGTVASYGSVAEYDDYQLRELVASLVEKKLLVKAEGLYPTLSLSDAGRTFLAHPKPLFIPKPSVALLIAKRGTTDDDIAFDKALFQELRVLRKRIADEHRVAAFIVFGDRTLREMAASYPQTPDAMRKIYGMSERKYEQYGQQFLAIIQRFTHM